MYIIMCLYNIITIYFGYSLDMFYLALCHCHSMLTIQLNHIFHKLVFGRVSSTLYPAPSLILLYHMHPSSKILE